ncbi:MAG: bifunctional fucokinase/fucose-1-phosphate guanylyltransferase [Verrucomicrobiota bacterium]|nr:bifunctional fucokinase/fucose-1-phosphate guanylyltransferase [Verrucomicrobiota bacterium]
MPLSTHPHPPPIMRTLLTLPQAMSNSWPAILPHCPITHAVADPPGQPIGSGAATAHLLHQAWREADPNTPFLQWLSQDPTLIIHAGGQSRRLPAYAPTGKVFAPIPVFRWSLGQTLTQTLLDLQHEPLSGLLNTAPPATHVLIASGDVLVRFANGLPPMPSADVIIFGLWIRPEQASQFGVAFCNRAHPEQLEFYLQKPPPDQIREESGRCFYMVDTGIWLLSDRAIRVLMERSGWDPRQQAFGPNGPQPYELYAQFGLGLGQHPVASDPDVNALSSAIIPLPQGEFHHFGKTSDLIHSSSALQNVILDQTRLGLASAIPHPDQYIQNAEVELPPSTNQHTLWIENAFIPKTWIYQHHHVFTGIPRNQWKLTLEPGTCLDFAPVEDTAFAIRPYGIHDPFRGAILDPATEWLGIPFLEWLQQREIHPDLLGCPADTDIQYAPLFPVLSLEQDLEGLIQWMVSPPHSPQSRDQQRNRWISARRISASRLSEVVNPQRLFETRRRHAIQAVPKLLANHGRSIFFNLDLEQTADLIAPVGPDIPSQIPPPKDVQVLKQSRFAMFSAAVLRKQDPATAQIREGEAFAVLREGIVDLVRQKPARPFCTLIEDQIISARSPVRLDLAGGWTDTPPYCLQFGGKVVNLAVDLNGHPPIQVFIKIRKTPDIVIRSIDLGTENILTTFEDIRRYDDVGSGFTIARAALAIAGFHPDFAPRPPFHSLREQLIDFGGGLEISLLAAIPKGSGLGTSSILAGSLLGTLNDLCNLQWDTGDLILRTLALEQLLTTGGGWQDQAGALFPGIKLLRTQPGLDQTPNVQWLPAHGIHSECSSDRIMLYYTGITRIAKNILQEIVRGMFLNSSQRLGVLEEIGLNALFTARAVQENKWEALAEAIRRSWRLNQALDSGTNPPEIQSIINLISPDVDALKLLGAGGGGYMLILAKDPKAGARIRHRLQQNRPNSRSRFITIALNSDGMRLARS